MKYRILLAVGLALLAAAPAVGQYNDVAANNTADTAVANNDTAAAADNVAATTPAPAANTPADTAAATPAPEPPPSRAPMSFPWGVLGLLGLVGLIGSRKGAS